MLLCNPPWLRSPPELYSITLPDTHSITLCLVFSVDRKIPSCILHVLFGEWTWKTLPQVDFLNQNGKHRCNRKVDEAFSIQL